MIIDGEAVCCGDDGVPSFDRIRYRRQDASVCLYAFDLIELNGDDLRREPLDTRKTTFASLIKRAAPGLRLNALAIAANQSRYSITSSAWIRRGGGTSRPMIFAVVKLTTISNLVGCCTGRSAGRTPFKTWPT